MFVEDLIVEKFLKILRNLTSTKVMTWENNTHFDEEIPSPISSINEWYRSMFTETMWIYLLCFPDREQYTLYVVRQDGTMCEIACTQKHPKMHQELFTLYKTIKTVASGMVIDEDVYEQMSLLLSNYGVATGQFSVEKLKQ